MCPLVFALVMFDVVVASYLLVVLLSHGLVEWWGVVLLYYGILEVVVVGFG